MLIDSTAFSERNANFSHFPTKPQVYITWMRIPNC